MEPLAPTVRVKESNGSELQDALEKNSNATSHYLYRSKAAILEASPLSSNGSQTVGVAPGVSSILSALSLKFETVIICSRTSEKEFKQQYCIIRKR